MTNLLPLPVLLPLLGAALTLALRRSPRLQRFISITVLSGVVAVSAMLVYQTDQHGVQVLWIGGWAEPLGIALVCDRLAALMLLVSSLVTLLVLIFSIGQGISDSRRDTPLSIYYPTYLVLAAGIGNAFLAGDLFNLFVGFEVLLFASYVLITLGGTGTRIRAGTTYIVVSLLSSILFLVALAAIYGATGTVNLAQLSQRLGDIGPGVSLMLQLLLLSVFAIKAAVFPLSAWLPDSYPTAPAPVTAVFAGLLTKVGVYAIIRVQTLLFPQSPLHGLLLWAALLTMIVGVLGAVAQSDIKRMLSFTLVSHIGYMIFGIGLSTPAGFAGAIFYVAHHITIQTALFLIAGLIERFAGSTSLSKLGGLAAVSPRLAVLFFICFMNLAGIPPLSGFLGKIGLMQAGIDVGTPMAITVVVGGIVTSLLTLYALAKAWSQAFWRTPHQALVSAVADASDVDLRHIAEHDEYDLEMSDLVRAADAVDGQQSRIALPKPMFAAAAAVTLMSLLISVVAGPMYSYAERSAQDMSHPELYINAVLPVGVR